MITTGLVIRLGIAQLISWGTAYYLIGNFGTRLAQQHGWSETVIYAGFSLSLLVMGAVSPLCGKLIDQHGGRKVMATGSIFHIGGCVTLAWGTSLGSYFVAWLLLGIAMRLTLYDAAFATLARIGGAAARRSMGQITLFGGLASTIFWPLGHYIDAQFGLTIALLSYAGFAFITLPLHLSLPRTTIKPNHDQPLSTPHTRAFRPLPDREQVLCGALYAVIMSLINIINAAMSAHMIALLAGLGLIGAQAINIASLRGFGQLASRLADTLFGRNFNPAIVTISAALLLTFAFIVGFASGISLWAATVFTVSFGAANGVLTITRGTLPLMIFDARHYGKRVGSLLLPGFILSALAPSLFAMAMTGLGANAVLGILCVLSLSTLIASVVLYAQITKKPPAL
jgi:MFS family permease